LIFGRAEGPAVNHPDVQIKASANLTVRPLALELFDISFPSPSGWARKTVGALPLKTPRSINLALHQPRNPSIKRSINLMIDQLHDHHFHIP
jgi:hypothetical protein